MNFTDKFLTRNLGIDVLRGVAVLLVLFRHSDTQSALQKIGWVGVDLFFVVSGYLVSGLLFKELREKGSISYKRFFIRRGFKIYPLFFLLVLVTWFLQWKTEGEINPRDFIGEITFTQNYIGHFWNHTWSLAVEEHFYLLLPLVIIIIHAAFKTDYLGKTVTILLLINVVVLLLRILNYRIQPFSEYTHAFPTHLRIDSLFAGVLLQVLSLRYGAVMVAGIRKYWAIWIWVPVVALLGAFLFDLDSWYINTVGYTLLYLGFALLMLLLSTWSSAKQLPTFLSPIFLLVSAIGYYSYSIYLFHMMWDRYLLGATHSLFNYPTAWNTPVYFVGAILVGIVASELIEQPLLKLRNKWFP